MEQLKENTYGSQTEWLINRKHKDDKFEEYFSAPEGSETEKVAYLQFSIANFKEAEIEIQIDNTNPKIQQARQREIVAEDRYKEVKRVAYARSPERTAIKEQLGELHTNLDILKKKSEAKNPETTHLQKELRLEGTNIRKK